MHVREYSAAESPVKARIPAREGVRKRWRPGLIARPRSYGVLLRCEPTINDAVGLARALSIVEEVACLAFVATEDKHLSWGFGQRAALRRALDRYVEADVIEPAAVRVFVSVHAVLIPFEGERLSSASLRQQVERAARHARRAVEADLTIGTPGAKRCQLAATGGRSLAVCAECHVVFPDSTSTRGPHPFRSHCAACADRSNARRVEVRERRMRAYEAGREEIAAGVWWGVCTCGRDFTSSRPDTKRCDRCRRGHRAARG